MKAIIVYNTDKCYSGDVRCSKTTKLEERKIMLKIVFLNIFVGKRQKHINLNSFCNKSLKHIQR